MTQHCFNVKKQASCNSSPLTKNQKIDILSVDILYLSASWERWSLYLSQALSLSSRFKNWISRSTRLQPYALLVKSIGNTFTVAIRILSRVKSKLFLRSEIS